MHRQDRRPSVPITHAQVMRRYAARLAVSPGDGILDPRTSGQLLGMLLGPLVIIGYVGLAALLSLPLLGARWMARAPGAHPALRNSPWFVAATRP